MAAAKAIAGHCAMFLVTPLSGALLVWITFAIGRRLDSDALGLAAAWLVATSPAVLAMLVSPMSDVPAAAFWAVAIYFTLGHIAALGAVRRPCRIGGDSDSAEPGAAGGDSGVSGNSGQSRGSDEWQRGRQTSVAQPLQALSVAA